MANLLTAIAQVDEVLRLMLMTLRNIPQIKVR
jgi:hypothetical protein